MTLIKFILILFIEILFVRMGFTQSLVIYNDTLCFTSDTLVITYIEDTVTFKYLYSDENGLIHLGDGLYIDKIECYSDGTLMWYPYERRYLLRKDNQWIEAELKEYPFLVPIKEIK